MLLGVGFGSAMFGSLLTVGILGLSGLLAGPPKPTVRDRLLTNANDEARTNAARSVRPSMVKITFTTTKGPKIGAGFCVQHGGLILTATSVVAGHGGVTITTPKGETMPATVVGRDPISGLALLEAAADLPAASLATHAPNTSQSVIVLGGDATIGEGIINATGHVEVNSSGLSLPNLLITSARPAQAEAGSALVDTQGKVAGLLLGGDAGVVPIDYARQVIDQLTANGVADHAWVGMHGRDSTVGPLVTTVDAASPAATAGAQIGDIVTKVDNRATLTVADMQALIRWRWALDKIAVVVIRKGELVTLTMQAVGAPVAATTAGATSGTTHTTSPVTTTSHP